MTNLTDKQRETIAKFRSADEARRRAQADQQARATVEANAKRERLSNWTAKRAIIVNAVAAYTSVLHREGSPVLILQDVDTGPDSVRFSIGRYGEEPLAGLAFRLGAGEEISAEATSRFLARANGFAPPIPIAQVNASWVNDALDVAYGFAYQVEHQPRFYDDRRHTPA